MSINNTNYGTSSLNNNSGSDNSSFGAYSAYNNLDGSCNTAIGSNSLFYNTIGSYNTSVGAGSLCNNDVGSRNTAVGSSALEGLVSNQSVGNRNTAVGAQALFSNTGDYNTGVGTYAALDITTGNYNTFLGANTTFSNTANTYEYSTALGYGAAISTSNQIMMGRTNTNVMIPGSAQFQVYNPNSYNDLSVVAKEYVDSVAGGLTPSFSCICATTASINGGGIPSGSPPTTSTDDITITNGDYVLVINQGGAANTRTNNVNNGLWIVNLSGAWSRPPSGSMSVGTSAIGDYNFVQSGTTYGSRALVQISNPAIVGTDPLQYTLFYQLNVGTGQGLNVTTQSGKQIISVDSSLNFINYLDNYAGPNPGIMNIGGYTSRVIIGPTAGNGNPVIVTNGITGPTGSFNIINSNTDIYAGRNIYTGNSLNIDTNIYYARRLNINGTGLGGSNTQLTMGINNQTFFAIYGNGADSISLGNGSNKNVNINYTTESTTSASGSLVTAGGVGIIKNLNVGGNVGISGNITGATGSFTNISTNVISFPNNNVQINGSTSQVGQGANAVAVGASAGQTNQSSNAIAIGVNAGTNSQGVSAVAIGNSAGRTNQLQNAIAIGINSGTNSQGVNAVAVGASAGQNNQSQNAIAIGVNAGINSQGTNAIAIGNTAGQTNQGGSAVAIGNSAGQNSQGADAVAIGINSGSVSQGGSAVAIGNSAGQNSQGDTSVAVGLSAGNIRQGASAVAIGTYAGQNTQGTHSIAIGSSAGRTNQGASAVAIGNCAGRTNQSQNAIAIGVNSGQNTQGTNAVAIGASAGETNQGANAVAIGNSAGQNSQGTNSVAIGVNAGQISQSDNAIAIGQSAGQSNQGAFGIAIGTNSGQYNQGINAVALGNQCAFTGQSAYAVAIGNTAGRNNQGSFGIAIGVNAGYTGQGTNSVAIGLDAGKTNQPANSIVINASGIGLNGATASAFYANPVRSNNSNTAGNMLNYNTSTSEISYTSNVFYNNGNLGIGTTTPSKQLEILGSSGGLLKLVNSTSAYQGGQSNIEFWNNNSGYRLGQISAIDTATTIGSVYRSALALSASFHTDNFVEGMRIVSQSASTAFVGIGTTSPAFTLDVSGNTRSTGTFTSSDYRLKTNIKPLLRSIDDLKPLEYDLDGKHDMGFIAHEVQEVFPFLVNGEKDGTEMQSLNYTGFIALLVKEVQELKKENKLIREKLEQM